MCPTGFVSLAAGLTACQLCGIGKFPVRVSGATECMDCPVHGMKCSEGLLHPQDGY